MEVKEIMTLDELEAVEFELEQMLSSGEVFDMVYRYFGIDAYEDLIKYAVDELNGE